MLEVVAADTDLDWRFFGAKLLAQLKVDCATEGSIKSHMDRAKRLLNKAAAASDNAKLKREIRGIVGGRSANGVDAGFWPALREVEYNPTKSLEEVFGRDLNYTNDQYVGAIIDYASAYIHAWSNIRSRLRNNHTVLFDKIIQTVERFGIEDLRELERKQTYSEKILVQFDEWSDLLQLNIEILVTMDEPLLNMIALAQYRKLRHFDRFSASVDLPANGAAGFAKQLLRDDGAHSRPKTQWTIWSAGKRDAYLSCRLMFSLLDFLGPTLEEELCFTWLLACRRIQLSNVDRLRRAQIDEDSKSIWIRSYKGRNGKAQNVNINKNTNFGRALRHFLSDYDKFPLKNGKSEYMTTNYKPNWAVFSATSNFHHLAFPDHLEGLDTHGLSHSKLTVMKDIYSVIVSNQRLAGRAGNYGDVERPVMKALNPSSIAQSYVYAEEAKRGSFSRSLTMELTCDRENDEEQDRKANIQFHTRAVRENVYRARSRDKLKLEKGKAFAVAVSAEMTNVANDIIDAWSKSTSELSLPALIDLIGLRGNISEVLPETLLAAAKAEKFIVEKSGLIKKNGKVYFFDSGLTARMMMEEIRHIEGELEGLFATLDIDKALNAWAKLCFLELLMKRFSAASLKDALDKYGHLKGRIPHAPISEGGNSWIVM